MLQLLEHADKVRQKISSTIAQEQKSELGQFMTPLTVARFMATLFPASTLQTCRLLDPGAGTGSLSSAFLERWAIGGFSFQSVQATAYEIDATLRTHLKKTLANYAKHLALQPQVIAGDFIELATQKSLQGQGTFTHAILNPPYKKIKSSSQHRLILRSIGIETVNLYSAFIALSLKLMAPGGQMVAIVPRSFCNGPYYRPFRDYILKYAALRHIHLFDSRSKAFKDDEVLQENIIIRLECAGQQGDVTITTSTDDSFADLTTFVHPFDRIVFPNDTERFIHIPTSHKKNLIERSTAFQYSLTDIGIKVSTGPVVDFRLKDYLHSMPKPGTVPLLYPCHFSAQQIKWPLAITKKPNAIYRNTITEKWLYPTGFYCVVRRFSSKEEKRRIVANTVQPSSFPNAKFLGFENHLNVFHEDKQGLPEALARGLTVFLNSSAVDESFRRFNGHTQVNATDLKLMKYPSRKALIALGKKVMKMNQNTLTQAKIDKLLDKLAV